MPWDNERHEKQSQECDEATRKMALEFLKNTINTVTEEHKKKENEEKEESKPVQLSLFD